MYRILHFSAFILMGCLMGFSTLDAQSHIQNTSLKTNSYTGNYSVYTNTGNELKKRSGNRQNENGGQTFVRIYDNIVSYGTSFYSNNETDVDNISLLDSICNLKSYAKHGQIAPGTGGGTLNPVAFMNPTTINSSGYIAFFSQVNGSTRNQGVFAADSNSIYAIAIGCGLGGGSGDTSAHSGDPSPIGGTFSGFFGGTAFAPAVNNSGDVLFICDVNGGSSYRGLFLYRAATHQVVKVAAVGDPSPIGGTFAAVGPGSINNNGKVVFLASPVGTTNSNIFMWDNGVVSKIAAIGDPAPGGGTYSLLGTESYGFQDGTNIPIGPVPDINDSDQITFRAIVSGGITDRGIIVRSGGIDEWYIKVPDPTPIGGTYLDMQAASINNAGQIAFFADFHPTPSTTSSGWFAGSPGNWRKVVAFYDSIDGGQCLGLAFSRNPMQAIDSAGNVVFWTDLSSSGGVDRMILGLANGDYLIAVRRGDPSPIGGTIGSMDAWPSLNNSFGTLNAATPGAAGGALSAHMVFSICNSEVPVELTSFTAGSNGDVVTLNWSTATETNNRGFEIQKNQKSKLKNQKWEKIGFVAGNGTTSKPEIYSFVDKDVTSGTYSYRLKQIDFDGACRYSNTVEVNINIPSQFSLSQNYPNPFNPTTTINYSIQKDGNVSLKVYNTLGQQVAELINGNMKAGQHQVTFDASKFVSGIYYYRLEAGNNVSVKKMILLK